MSQELIRGLTGTKAVVVCKIRIIKDTSIVSDKIKATQPGDCLVADKFDKMHNAYLDIAAGFIQNTGGPNCHGNQYAKDWNSDKKNEGKLKKASISSTMDTQQANGDEGRYATEHLKDGQMVMLNSFTGEVTREDSTGELTREKQGAVYEYEPGMEALVTKIPEISRAPDISSYEAKYG